MYYLSGANWWKGSPVIKNIKNYYVKSIYTLNGLCLKKQVSAFLFYKTNIHEQTFVSHYPYLLWEVDYGDIRYSCYTALEALLEGGEILKS